MKIFLVVCLGILGGAALAAEQARLSIPEVLNPDTRIGAFQRFCVSGAPDDTKKAEMEDAKSFARCHLGLNVTVSPDAPGGPRYLLSWLSLFSDSGNWGEQEGTPESRPRTSQVLVPREVQYQMFSSTGEPLASEERSTFKSVAIDVDGDGSPELITPYHWDVRTAEAEALRPPLEVDFLVVSPAGARFDKVSLAILYNVKPQNRALKSPWSFQVRPGRGGENCTLELGPADGLEGVEPIAVFRWDKAKGGWTQPERKPGDHFIVITSEDPSKELSADNVFQEAERLAREGALDLPLQDPPSVSPLQDPSAVLPPSAGEPPQFASERVDKNDVSKPYQKRSLAGLSNEETLAYMGARRSIREYVQARTLKPAAVPDLWTQDPAQAALAYVRANRPPQLDAQFLYQFATGAGEAAPGEGDFTLTDGPSGCFAPGGAYVHHLHCAREGSFLAQVRTLHPWANVSHIVAHDRAEVRKLDLSHEQARRLLQTLWWMSRLRTRPLSSRDGSQYFGGSSTSDGEATVQIVAEKEKVTITATRSDDTFMDFMGTSEFSAGYSTTSFINLAVRLLEREVPAWLGEAWTSQAPPDWGESWPFEKPQPAEELIAARQRVAGLLQLALERKVAPDLVGPAVGMVGDNGWHEMRPALEKLATQLPPPFAWEIRIGEIEKELAVWQKKFGEAASERASWKRRYPPSLVSEPPDPALAIPGLVSNGPAKPKPAPKENKFAALDALYAEQSSARWDAPHVEQEISALRTLIPYALRQLTEFNDPEALFRWATKERGSAAFCLPRLAALDPPRALRLLDWWEKEDPREDQREQFARDRAKLKGQAWKSDAPLPREKRAAYLAQVRRAKTSDEERRSLLGGLLPASDPARYRDPGIDEALLEFLRSVAKANRFSDRDLTTAAAVRLGGKAWDAVVGNPKLAPERMSFFSDSLPALGLIAQREPRLYRDKFKALLAPELGKTHGDLDAVLFAVWRFDLRELRPELEKIATSGPDDYEGGYTRGHCTPAQPVDTQRYHRARHILALWDETDASTRARLQIAFAVGSPGDFARKADGALDFLCQSLQAGGLKPAERAALREWSDWCEQNAPRLLGREPVAIAALLKEVRKALTDR